MSGYWKKDKQGEESMTKEVFVPKETMKDVEGYPYRDLPERGIRKETMERFGVKVGLSESDGKTIVAVYFPSYNQKGRVTGYKKQDLTKDKSEKFHWSTVGSVSIQNKLFGQDVAESIQRKRNSLTLTEGEWDTMSCFQAQCDQVKGTKFAGMEPFVCSIPMGTANAVEAVLHNQEFTLGFSDLNIFFDDDYCTPAEKTKNIMKGHEAREAVANALVGSGISLFTTTTTGDFKDASDMLQADQGIDLAKLVQFGKRQFSAEKIASAGSISFDEVIAKPPEGVYIKSFPMLMEKIHGFRGSELTLLTSGSGVGKSTLTSIFAADFIEASKKVGLIFLEETKVQTLQRMIAHKLKVNYNKFKENPLSVATHEEIKAAYDSIVDNDMAVFLDHFGNLPVSELMSKVKHMHLVCKCDFIIIDHLTLCASGGGGESDERRVLDQVMTELAAFCSSNKVGIIAISHINRGGFADNKPPKDAEEKPYWVKVDKSHMRGSAALEQLSWTILGVENQIMPDRSRGNVRITVLKNRTFGSLGVADEFKLNQDTWAVELAGQDPCEF
jgi:archaellum biogenesis ATPase FlaH